MQMLRRQLRQCIEVNTLTEFIYCDRIDRIAIDYRTILMVILHAVPQHIVCSMRTSVQVTWNEKGGKRFSLSDKQKNVFCSFLCFASFSYVFHCGRPLPIVVRTRCAAIVVCVAHIIHIFSLHYENEMMNMLGVCSKCQKNQRANWLLLFFFFFLAKFVHSLISCVQVFSVVRK